MLRFRIVAKDKAVAGKVRKTAVRLGLKPSDKPEFIISIGGDGTFLRAERMFPGIPKLLIKDSDTCQRCDDLEYDDIFMCMAGDEFTIQKHMKLEGRLNSKKFLAVNDFVVRNRLQMRAIRFSVIIDNKDIYPLIGDGVVIASPFGSTGYFHSITKHRFTKGIGVAFNNVTTKIRHRILNKSSIVSVRLHRHDADLTVDNDLKIQTIKEDQTLIVKASDKYAKIIHPKKKRWALPFRQRRK